MTLTTADKGGTVTEYSMAWTSAVGGTVSQAVNVKRGEIIGAKFVPGSGADQPTNLYDVTLEDGDSVDVLAGTGANLSNGTSTRAVPLLSTYGAVWFEGGQLTLTVANAGDTKKGTVKVWVRG